MNKELRPSVFLRFAALIIDIIILGAVGYISGLFLEDFYVSLGKYGTLVGTLLILIYYSLLQSHLGKGQSIGKRAIGAKVTDLNGNYLSVKDSFLRAFIYFFPIMNAGIFSKGSFSTVIIVIFTLFLFTTIYFILVNKSRRCLHDILMKTVVTNKNVTEFEVDEKHDINNSKVIPIAVIVAVIIVISFVQSLRNNSFSELISLKEKIESREGVISATKVQKGVSKFFTRDTSNVTSYINVVVWIDNKDEAMNRESKYFDNFLEIIKKEIPEYRGVDQIVINLYHGYNIGIASKTRSMTRVFRNEENMNEE
jgi:uncharacterized RDD family membrane protein YckC